MPCIYLTRALALQENLTAANAAAQAVGNDDGGQTPLAGGSNNAVKVPLSPFGPAETLRLACFDR